MDAGADSTVFQAVIVPHRSLSPRALRGLFAALLLGSGASTGLAVALGAWPVCCFTAVAPLLAGALLLRHARSPAACELIELTETALRVTRSDGRGASEQRVLAPGWLEVVLQHRRGRVPALLLVSHGRREEVAADLCEAEKRDLAEALRRALHRWRSPAHLGEPPEMVSRDRPESAT